jgi:hypothetical protein
MFDFIASIWGTIAITVVFYSTLRIFDFTIFDFIALGYSLFMAPRLLRQRHYVILLEFPFWIAYLLLASFIVSAAFVTDPSGHATRCAIFLIDYCLMVVFAYVVATSGYFSKHKVYDILCISGTASSIVCILQGKFDLFTSLFEVGPIEFWERRFPGLAEHPIEASIIAGYSAVLALANMLDGKSVFRKMAWGAAFAISLYSMQYSASFTGMLGLGAGVCLLLLFRRAWLPLGIILAAAVLLAPMLVSRDFLGDSLIRTRLEELLTHGQNFETAQARHAQISAAIQMISNNPRALLFGFGYSDAGMGSDAGGQGYDIHNIIVGAVFHFGLLGLFAQCAILIYIIRSLLFETNRNDQSIIIALFAIFMSFYLTGPAPFRRSLWTPLIFCAMVSRAQRLGMNEQGQEAQEQRAGDPWVLRS